MAVSEVHASGKLELLAALSDPEPNVDLVLIPGVGTTSAREWGICQVPWLSALRQDQTRLRLIEFQYQVLIDDQFCRRLILEQGVNLLRELSQLRSDPEVEKRPLLLVSHSLGGCILKQAIAIAFQHPRYDALLNVITGIVFLSTPHGSPREDVLAEQCLSILKAGNSGISNKQTVLQKKNNDASLLNNLALRFHDVTASFDILSVYEEKKITISRTFSRNKKVLLVDKDLVEIGALREEIIGLPLSHLDICKMSDESGAPHLHIKDWFQKLLKDSVSNIEDRMRLYEPQRLSDSWSEIDASQEAINHALSKTKDSAETGNTSEGQYGSSESELEIVPLANAFAPARKQAILPCISLGGYARNTDFTGRSEDLDVLDRVLIPSQERLVSSQPPTPRQVVVWGGPGLGKTELALEFAYSRQHKFDAIFWIHADTSSKLELDFADIAVKLGLADAKENRDPVVNRETAKGWLSKPTKLLDPTYDTVGQTEASWLIVLDNADDPAILTDYARIFGSGSWLITSRHPLAKTAFSLRSTAIDLKPLDDCTGAKLLQRLTHAEDQENLSPTVSHRLGGHPLSITQMAGYIRREYMPLKIFLEVYQEETDRHMESPTGSVSSLNMLDLELEQRPERARGTMASIWAIDNLNVASRSLLDTMVFLDPDCIQDYLMKDRCAQRITNTHFPKRLKPFYAARAELMHGSLLKSVNNDTGVRIHRVLQDTARVKLKRNLDVCFADTVAVLYEAWPPVPVHKVHDVERWPRCKELYTHVTCLRRRYKKQFLEDKPEFRFQYAKLLCEAGWYQHAIGNSYAIRCLLDEALQICETCDKTQENQDLVTDIHYTLGAIANETNDTKSCLKHTTAFLEIRLQIAEETQVRDARLAIAYNESGIAKMMSKNFDEAEKLFKKAIEVYGQLPEFRKDMNTVSHANRGLAAWLKGDLPRAVEIFEQAIKDREELFGFLDTENFRCGRLWHGLGNVRYSQGEFQQSWECHQNAFKQAQATVGTRHHRFADICHRIALHLLRRSDLECDNPNQMRIYIDQALEIINQALEIWNVNKTIYKPEIARSSFLKAKILHRDGAIEQASSLFKEAAKSRREISGDRKKLDRDLSEEDFDELVTFWSM